MNIRSGTFYAGAAKTSNLDDRSPIFFAEAAETSILGDYVGRLSSSTFYEQWQYKERFGISTCRKTGTGTTWAPYLWRQRPVANLRSLPASFARAARSEDCCTPGTWRRRSSCKPAEFNAGLVEAEERSSTWRKRSSCMPAEFNAGLVEAEERSSTWRRRSSCMPAEFNAGLVEAEGRSSTWRSSCRPTEFFAGLVEAEEAVKLDRDEADDHVSLAVGRAEPPI